MSVARNIATAESLLILLADFTGLIIQELVETESSNLLQFVAAPCLHFYNSLCMQQYFITHPCPARDFL